MQNFKESNMSDGIFQIHNFNVQLNSLDDQINLYPFSDVHRNAPGCDVPRWHRYLEWLKDDPTGLAISLGDENDFASWSGRKKLKAADLHDTELNDLDELAMMKEDVFFNEIEFLKGRMLGFVSGNHLWEYFGTKDPKSDFYNLQGVTSSERLAERMETAHLGDLAYIRVYFTFKGKHKSRTCHIDIVACHGKAGGKLVGTSVNQVDDLKKIFPVADIYIMGHDHQRYGHPTSTLDIGGGKKKGLYLKQKRQWLVRSGSFLKAMEPGVPSYLVGRYLKPNELGAIKLEISFKRDCKGGKDTIEPDIHCWS